MAIQTKRAYEEPSRKDGTRVLVDRLWPRGVSKEKAKIAHWLKDIGSLQRIAPLVPRASLQWPIFRKRYLEELDAPEVVPLVEQLLELANHSRTLTLVYASRMTEKNNATVLRQLIEGTPKPPKSSGPSKVEAGSQRARARAPR